MLELSSATVFDCMHICLTGSPRSGKSTLAHQLSQELKLPVFSFDSMLNSNGWSSQLTSEAASLLIDTKTPKIFEGVQLPRILRRAYELTDVLPIKQLIYIANPKIVLTPGQAGMQKAVLTVFMEVERKLQAQGIEIDWRP